MCLSTKYVSLPSVFSFSLSLSGKAGYFWFAGSRVVVKAESGAEREDCYGE